MKATATDSLSDAASTTAVLISSLIGYFTNIQTDAYMGLIVAALILFAGIKILNETKNSILGSPPEQEVVDAVASISLSYPEILGIHDIVIHNYGPGNTIASLHAEVDGSANIFDTHDVIDNLEKRLFNELGVRATVHMDPIVTDDEKVNSLKEITLNTVLSIDERLNIHDFRYVEGTTHSNLIFDVVAPFELKLSDNELKDKISSAISRVDPTYFVVITVDRE
jgi:divalent metal cation (Fe/Co/Zn/Cd) transporter